MKAQLWEIENAIEYIYLPQLNIVVEEGETDTWPEALELWYQRVIDALEHLARNPDVWPEIFRYLALCEPEDVQEAIRSLIDQKQEAMEYASDEANWE